MTSWGFTEDGVLWRKKVTSYLLDETEFTFCSLSTKMTRGEALRVCHRRRPGWARTTIRAREAPVGPNCRRSRRKNTGTARTTISQQTERSLKVRNVPQTRVSSGDKWCSSFAKCQSVTSFALKDCCFFCLHREKISQYFHSVWSAWSEDLCL